MPRHHTPRFTIPHATPRLATLYTIRLTLCAVRLTPYALHFMPYAIRFMLYTVRLTLYAIHLTLYAIRHTPSQFPSIWWMDGLDRVIAGPARQKPLHTTCRVQRVSQNNPYPGPQVSPSPSIYNPHPQPQVPLPKEAGGRGKGVHPPTEVDVEAINNATKTRGAVRSPLITRLTKQTLPSLWSSDLKSDSSTVVATYPAAQKIAWRPSVSNETCAVEALMRSCSLPTSLVSLPRTRFQRSNSSQSTWSNPSPSASPSLDSLPVMPDNLGATFVTICLTINTDNCTIAIALP